MAKEYGLAEAVEAIAQQAIPLFHPHLATARIVYLNVDKGSRKAGKPVLGKVKKISGPLEFLLEKDFMIEVALDFWNELSDTQRQALVDHLLERCYGEEDEDSGEMIWSIREPDVQEFSTILRRHGAWNEGLAGFVSVAKTVNLDEMVADVIAEGVAEEMTTSVLRSASGVWYDSVGYKVQTAQVWGRVGARGSGATSQGAALEGECP